MHAKEIFNTLIKGTVAPFLKRNGFQKKSLNFYRKKDGLLFMINFQNDTSNSHWNNRFFVNIGIHSPSVAKTLDPSAEIPAKIHLYLFSDRVNQITGSAYPFHELNEEANLEDTTIYLMSDLEKLMTFFNKITSDEALMDILIYTRGLYRYEEALLYIIRTGKMDKMKGYAQKIFAVKINVGDRWSFFENRINSILAQEGIEKSLVDYIAKLI